MARPAKSKASFDVHLEAMRQARCRVDDAVSSLDQARGQADHAVTVTWEFPFDHLCRANQKELSLPQINMAAIIIYRLIQSIQKLSLLKAEARANAKELANLVAQAVGLPPELREELEKELQLMG